MSDERPKGIVDPWRKVESLRPSKREPAKTSRKDLSDIDMDADLAIPGRYVIRTAHAAFDILHVNVDTPGHALDQLAGCILELRYVKNAALQEGLALAGIHVRSCFGVWGIPYSEEGHAAFKSARSTIWFVGRTLDEGALALARALRLPGAQTALRKWGITPML